MQKAISQRLLQPTTQVRLATTFKASFKASGQLAMRYRVKYIMSVNYFDIYRCLMWFSRRDISIKVEDYICYLFIEFW